MTFDPSYFSGFIAKDSEIQARLFTQYQGTRDDFDVIIIGSGIGGGILADDLADRVGDHKRILVLEAGSYVFPTHVYNISRFDNASIARRFACANFYQYGGFDQEYYIHEQPQLNLGGRSIFWSGLIPTAQPWELHYFPDQVSAALNPDTLREAGRKMNQSASLGSFAEHIVEQLTNSPLNNDFIIEQTPRALHQPYLSESGAPLGRYFKVPTGVFNTSELLINQLGPDRNHDGNGLHVQIHQYVEDIQAIDGGWYRVLGRTTTTGQPRYYYAPKVVLSAGSIESPKLLNRSSVAQNLSGGVRALIGRGLTDHPTTDGRTALVSHCGALAIPKDQHAKVILYSRGQRDNGEIRFPFNVEININHEYWHWHDIDPDSGMVVPPGDSVLDFKFSFANCIDMENGVRQTPPYQYVAKIDFRNLHWASHTAARLNALAGWNKSPAQIFDVLNGVGQRLLNEFSYNGNAANATSPLGQDGRGFGRGTVHHAACSLHMPYRAHLDAPVNTDSVVDENLAIRGIPGLYACDMSVMPLSTAANPVRTMAALALRLSGHLF